MCKRKYRLRLVTVMVLVMAMMFSGCDGTAKDKKKDAEIIEVVPGYVVEVDDPRELAGIVDYVFVASMTDTGEVKDISDELELPLLYILLGKHITGKNWFLAIIITVNTVTTILTAIVERVICEGFWALVHLYAC